MRRDPTANVASPSGNTLEGMPTSVSQLLRLVKNPSAGWKAGRVGAVRLVVLRASRTSATPHADFMTKHSNGSPTTRTQPRHS